jgi:uncharacterized protein (TIGR02117 family)
MAPLGPPSPGGIALVVLVGLLWGCAGPVKDLHPPGEGEAASSVYVVNHGWHTGIVLRRDDFPEGIWPERNDFVDSEYLEVGWGDADFYRAEEPTWGLALKAAVWSASSVLYIVGLGHPPDRFLPPEDRVEVRLSARGLSELAAFIAMAYARDESGRAILVGPGAVPNSRFYLARGTYLLLNTCNTWVARALRAAGCPITPLYAVTAGNAMFQARRCAGALRSD